MNVFEVTITPQAESQLENIAHYIASELKDPDAAENLVDDIIDAVEGLSHNPEKYHPIDDEPWGSQGVRKIHIKNYYAYFGIDNENSTVWIIAIVYAKRDQKKFLSSLNNQS